MENVILFLDGLNIAELFNFISENVLIKQLVTVLFYLVAAIAVDILINQSLRRVVGKITNNSSGALIDCIHRPVFFTVLFLGVLHALLFAELAAPWSVVLPSSINTLILIFWVVAINKVIGLLKAEQFSILLSRFEITVDIFNLTRKLVRILVLILGFVFGLAIWDVSLTPFFASAGIAGIAIALAVKDTLANFFGGISMFLDKAYKVGDYIILDRGERGEVVDVGMRSTRMKTRDDVLITVPNSILATTMITNESAPEPRFRIRVPVGVSYGSDVDKVERVLLEIANSNSDVVSFPEARVRMRAFGPSSLDFELLCWVAEPSLKGMVTHQLLKKTFYTFKSENINIPFPQMDVHLDKME